MGLSTAKLLASRGASISLADLNETAVQTAANELPTTSSNQKHIATVVDVRRSEMVNAWIDNTVKTLGKLDGAVNMAGVITPAKPITETSDEDWDFQFAVNAKGVFACLRAQLRAMGEGGSIVC